jgi:hypothetical protein
VNVVQTIGACGTILAVLVGGLWALFRFRHQQPDLPRVNATVCASLSTVDCVDYVSFTVKITHVSGDILSIRREDDDKRKRFAEEVDPHVEVSRLEHTAEKGDLTPIKEGEAKVLTSDYRLGSGEFVEDHGIVSVGTRQPKTVAYKALFTFTGRSGKEGHWTWSPTDILVLPDTRAATITPTRDGP